MKLHKHPQYIYVNYFKKEQNLLNRLLNRATTLDFILCPYRVYIPD